MILTERQWRNLKRVRWDDKQSRRVRQHIGDDKLVLGFDRKEKHWVIARLCDVTVMIQFGVKTIPTCETAPVIWKHWLDDDGTPLRVTDPRLISYIQRCDLWRQDSEKYHKQFDHAECDKMVGYVNRSPLERKFFEPQKFRASWETTHDRAAA